ncbi:formate/nitrite family of transporters-like protein [Mycolicibacterium vanbaalenii PYR-1]|uniref:Formate/nitrite family of transporters-like protein n=1 Tax=Mycolicibacterium vanbaalenii (strain DSM 7251 / JCM 13017 / BCRC 16820 / KCTC 9966 / NRRL B-24157 / PYR-1) TaxID=350058 RepID=A1TCK0_MYCVP|nr:formate/nitrite family of transporters-like protein [Mycolicibacterium vanbaalenii PYR-1]
MRVCGRRAGLQAKSTHARGLHGSGCGYPGGPRRPHREDTTVSQTNQRELGESDSPIEDELEYAFRRMVDEGTQRLHRSWREVLVTGFFGGTDIAVGVLAYLAVLDATQQPLLAALAFSVGFLALLLGRSELFTEGFLIPVTTVAAKRASVAQLAKLWTGTLAANLVGGWVLMWLIMTALPRLRAQTIESAAHYATAPLSAETVALSLLGGMVITLMTRMQHGTDAMVGKIAAAVAGAFLLAGLQLFHSILDSLLIFGALVTGHAPFGYLDWLGWFGYTVVGNIAGGLLLVTLLRLLRSKDRLREERHDADTA